MSLRRTGQLKLGLWYALLVSAVPSACANGVQQDFDEGEAPSAGGKGSGGALVTGGSGSVVPPPPKAGSSGTGGAASNPFGGSASTGGKATGGAGGMSGGGADNEGGSGGKATGGASGSATGGASGGSGGSGGSGSGPCACAKTLNWVDNTNITFSTGDCFKVGDATYEYVGTKTQTWANLDCNPTKQMAWCKDVGADYRFTLCP
jgi:hypothetical protein